MLTGANMDIKIEKKIGNNIRKLRKRAGFTQDYVATKLQLLGLDITRSCLAKIEVGQRHVYADEILYIKEVLGVTFEEIFCLNN